MFTGIITEMGKVVSLRKKNPGALLVLKAEDIPDNAAIGDSIAINGVCLTVVSRDKGLLTFDISDETLSSTNLGQLNPGERVNLEPSLRPDGRIGGHFVTGHVDAAGIIRSRTIIGDTCKIEIEAPDKVTSLLVEKGSVAVDGISLTVVDVAENTFTIVIIPHTAGVTTIGSKAVGESVNLEADIIGKYVARFLRKETLLKSNDEGLMKALMKSGYI
ncbi:MAG: riboflavin synthase [Nitrospirota bacterium]